MVREICHGYRQMDYGIGTESKCGLGGWGLAQGDQQIRT